mmetsp:Transcript_86469/g.181050  ORF Transcript_86469/g.181050 Transcript_86469/m.181050 type:complete len:396 (+) Transcript_86469:893-2080(+)
MLLKLPMLFMPVMVPLVQGTPVMLDMGWLMLGTVAIMGRLGMLLAWITKLPMLSLPPPAIMLLLLLLLLRLGMLLAWGMGARLSIECRLAILPMLKLFTLLMVTSLLTLPIITSLFTLPMVISLLVWDIMGGKSAAKLGSISSGGSKWLKVSLCRNTCWRRVPVVVIVLNELVARVSSSSSSSSPSSSSSSSVAATSFPRKAASASAPASAVLLCCCLLLAVSAPTVAGQDWRHLDPNLPLDESLIHPTKPIKPRDTLSRMGGTIGIPLPMGWHMQRLSQLGEGLGYEHVSTGKYCRNYGYPFLVESDDWPQDCQARCTATPTCMYFTVYLEHGWCQLSSRCNQELEAGDPSAVTFMKKVPHDECDSHSPPARCFGGWVAELSKPIKPRNWQPGQ